MQEIGNENIYLMEENDNKLTTIKFLKEENINLYSKYMNLKIVYEIGFHESKLDQIEKKYFIQNMQETLQIQRHKTNSLMLINTDSTIANRNIISMLSTKRVLSANKIQTFMKNTDVLIAALQNMKLMLQNINNWLNSKLQNINKLCFSSHNKNDSNRLKPYLQENNYLYIKNKELMNEKEQMKKEYVFLKDKCSKYSFLQMIESEQEKDPRDPTPENPENPNPLLGFIILDKTNDKFTEYKSTDSGNSFQSGSSINAFGTDPRRGEMNSAGIYVLPDFNNNNIGFYNLSSFGTVLNIQSQSGPGYHWDSCAFLDENTAVCATTTGDIYTYDLTNNYLQLKIVDNNPSGFGFQALLVTKEKQILAAFFGCIYIYNFTGSYLGYSNNSEGYINTNMYQMKEIRENIIVTAEYYSVYSHNISKPENTIQHKLLDKAITQNRYLTLEVLEWNTGNIAIGGSDYTTGSAYGYVELFHLDEDNDNLQPISNKCWVGQDGGCWIHIIREIQTGVIIFGGGICADICTWEYAVVPHKDPICFPLGEPYIWDIIALP